MMQWFLYLIGAAWIAFGSCAILYTDDVRSMMRAYLETTNPKIMAAVPAIVGLLLIVSGSASSHAWFVRLLGLLGMVKGVLIYKDPNGIYTKASEMIKAAHNQTYRLGGIILIIFGTALFSWIR